MKSLLVVKGSFFIDFFSFLRLIISLKKGLKMNNEFKIEKKEILKTCALCSAALCGLFVFSWGMSQYIDSNMQTDIYSSKTKKNKCLKRGAFSRTERLKLFQKRRQKE